MISNKDNFIWPSGYFLLKMNFCLHEIPEYTYTKDDKVVRAQIEAEWLIIYGLELWYLSR